MTSIGQTPKVTFFAGEMPALTSPLDIDLPTPVLWDDNSAVLWDDGTAIEWSNTTSISADSVFKFAVPTLIFTFSGEMPVLASPIDVDLPTPVLWDDNSAVLWDDGTAIEWSNTTSISADSVFKFAVPTLVFTGETE